MMTFNQLKSVFAALVLCMSISANAQTIWTANFSDQAASTANWVTTGSVNSGSQSWVWTNNLNAGFQDPGGAVGVFAAPTAANGYFMFNSDGNGNFLHDMRLTGVGVPANCSGKNDVRLRFFAEYAHFTSVDTSIVEVGISTNGTDFTYTEVLKNVAAGAIFENNIDIAVPTANNAAQVWVQIRWRGFYEFHLKVDDFELYDVPAPLTCAQNPNSLICDNFDTYNTTQKIVQQSPTNWGLWSNGAGGTTEDGTIVTTPVSSAPNSLKVFAASATGGPMDLVLKLQNKATGNYSLKWKMNIASGKQGYFNIQNIFPISGNGIFNGEYYFINGGRGFGISNGDTLGKWTFPYDTWFDFEQTFDLDNNVHRIFINGTKFATIPFTGNLGGIDFFGVNNTFEYYVDDLEYISLPPVVYNSDNCPTAVDISTSFGNAPGLVTNNGPYDITNATVSATDPTTGIDCHFQLDPLQGTQFYTFVGDGNRYSITSVDCGASPIVEGDTQFALYSGDCGSLTPVACNDDISGTDLHSSITFLTVPGTTYYLMVDSYTGEDGTYCLDILQVGNITCAQGTIGTNSVDNDGNLCFGENLADLMQVTPAEYVIPNTIPGVNGHLWCISSAPLSQAAWPGTIAGIASTTASSTITLVGLVNDGANFQPGTYYLTSVVLAGATLIDPAGVTRVFNLDVTNGCYFIGTSHKITLWPEMDPITIPNAVTNATAPGNNGAINITPAGGSNAILGLPYTYLWSNGATTQDISGLAPGTYTVVIDEPSGCVPDGTASITVSGFVSTQDPAVVSEMSLTPNPTTGLVNVQIALAHSVEVKIEVVNTLGQVLISQQLGNTNAVKQSVDLSTLATGTYFMRISLDSETAVRSIVVNR
jgi:hypothetical protein